MNNSIKVKTTTTTPTDNNFYNLFYPVIPHLSRIGVAAQIVSAITEAVTVYLIVQSNLSEQNKIVALLASIIAVGLIVYILEIGGRRFIQVLTRVTVWKKFNNLWYVLLFSFVSLVTIGIFYLSINLSTKGVNYAFTAHTIQKEHYDTSKENKHHKEQVATITKQFDHERQTLEKSYLAAKDATTTLFDAKINEHQSKVDNFLAKDKTGERWAKSHANKWKRKVQSTKTAKTSELSRITETYTENLKEWQNRNNEAIKAVNDQHKETIQAAQLIHESNHKATTTTAIFWGGLFSTLVGSCIVLAFVCIVIVEVFNRGAGMKLQHKQVKQDPAFFYLLSTGLKNRFGGLIRAKLETFAGIQHYPKQRQIGFNATNDSKDSFDINSINQSKVDNTKAKVSNLSSGNDSRTIHAISPINAGDDVSLYDHRMGRYTTAGTIVPQEQGDALKTGIKTVVIEKEKLSQCKYCQKEYQRNSKKQKFCSTSCRKANWKKENGREPFLKKKN